MTKYFVIASLLAVGYCPFNNLVTFVSFFSTIVLVSHFHPLAYNGISQITANALLAPSYGRRQRSTLTMGTLDVNFNSVSTQSPISQQIIFHD